MTESLAVVKGNDGETSMPVAELEHRSRTAFTSEAAAEAGKRSGVARRAKASAAAEIPSLAELRQNFDRADLATDCFVVAHDLIQRLHKREFAVRYARDVGSLVKALVEVGRLESGQHTSASVSLSVSATAEERDQRVAALRQALDARSSERDPKGTTGNTAGQGTGDAGPST